MANPKYRRTLVLLLGLLAVASAQVWEKKPYTEWSKGDCKKVLTDSPWVGKEGTTQPIQQAVSEERAEAGGGASALEINYRAQLRSALPIRQAMVRQAQLDNNYDKMTDEQKKAFDDNSAKFLGTEFPDHVLLHVTYESNVPLRDRELANYWQKQAQVDYKEKFNLIGSNKRKVSPLSYEAAPGAAREFQMIFPRKGPDGEPLIGPDDKELVLEFIAPGILSQRTETYRIVFPVKKMMAGGKLSY
jgi:hypothetical protein